MIKQDFLKHLETLPSLGWRAKLASNGKIRLSAPGRKNYQYCPITAVSKILTGKTYALGDYIEAGADVLAWSYTDTFTMGCAADGRVIGNFTRGRLLKALNLSDTSV